MPWLGIYTADRSLVTKGQTGATINQSFVTLRHDLNLADQKDILLLLKLSIFLTEIPIWTDENEISIQEGQYFMT